MVETPLIELKNICKFYGGKDGTPIHKVLHGIDLSIYTGEFVAIVGTSGSGKSTLMNILGCLDKASSGEYLFAGKNISNFEADELAYLRREAFGFVFQGYHLIPTLDTNHNIQVPAIYKGTDFEDREKKTDELLNRLGLEQRKNHYPNQLSGGQQQRVSIARALVNGGYIILADEPTGALDSKSGIEVMELLKELAGAGHTIILITHDSQVASQAQRVVRISDGLIIDDSKNSSYEIVNSKNSFEKRDFIEHMKEGVKKDSSVIADINEAIISAWKTLWVNRFRTLLTLLGIIIGVCSVIVLMGVGKATSQKALKQMETFGDVNRISIFPDIDKVTGIVGTITLNDVKAIEKLDNVEFVSPARGTSVSIKFGNVNLGAFALMTNENGLKIFNWEIENGEFFTKEDENNLAKVVVIGKIIKEKLFANDSAIGKYILINNIPFRVVGELSEMAVYSGDAEDDDMVVLPFTLGNRQLANKIDPKSIQLYIKDYNLANETVEDMTRTLKDIKGTDNFRINNNPSKIQAQQEANKQQNLLITLIGSISLIVGGIGIMNIMLMAVKERTKEIGIRMATGARQSDIKRQFLTEAVLVSFIGGIAGVVVAIFIGAVLISFNIELIFSIKAILIAFFSALITGLFFGYIPASKASKLDPVVALNGE
ncbi:macrolide-specific efflux protein, ATP-binding/permease protein MacB [Aliarcobacter faecis]|uniref:MacB family efflux pump subunit n=1 Tax=Aliarcobacter faecis TaxID=1564138 RepID=UPI0004B63AB2|nr:MacB family efflux pump subunit [Aliarcobacter faecis]QKF72892.1 macrolide-specific efflux protein, ATP-binding/permease protein MacB [Aliarcobacter faecis]